MGDKDKKGKVNKIDGNYLERKETPKGHQPYNPKINDYFGMTD